MNRSKVKVAEFIGTVAYAGRLPIAPGTWGSLVALITWYVVKPFMNDSFFLLLNAGIFFVGVVVSEILVEAWDDTDGDGVGDNEDTDDDGDTYSDADEDACGSNSMDASSVPSDFDGDTICDVLDSDDTDGPDAPTDGGTEPGFGNVPGFPALFATIALIGAALIGRRRDD